MKCYCFRRKVQDLLAESQTLFEGRLNLPFEGSRSKFLSLIINKLRSSASVRHKFLLEYSQGYAMNAGEKLDW